MAEQKANSRRVLVIGWDGGTLDLAGPWIKAGHLPTLARLQAEGAAGPLRSVLPVLSPSAWTSFATGVNPGRHGIYDFAQRAPDSYRLRLITAADVKAPTLWRLLSDAGKRVVVVNVPMTYPPEPVNGVMVTGLGTPDRQVFTFPAALSEDLRANGYRVNKTVFYRPGAEAAFLKDTYDQTQRVADAALDLLTGREWDFGMVVFRDTDELAHFLWKHMDASHPEHNPATDPPFRNALLDYYKYLDTLTAKLIEAAGPETDIIVMSDHGMGPLYKDVYLNEWLRQQDLLATRVDLKRPQGGRLAQLGLTSSNVSRLLQSIGLARFERWLRLTMGTSKRWLPANNRASFPDAIDWARTKAYSYGYHGQLFLNVKGREAEGVVEPGEDYANRRAAIKHALEQLVDPEDKQPVVSNIILQEDAFNGPYAANGPDLVIVMRDLAYITRHGYEFSGKQGYIFNTPASHESGSHRHNGMVFLHGSGFASRPSLTNCSILDLAPTIMQLFGLRVPEQMEGAALIHNIRDETLANIPPDRYDTSQPAIVLPEAAELTEEDEKELSDRLKNLGYLE